MNFKDLKEMTLVRPYQITVVAVAAAQTGRTFILKDQLD